MQIKNLFSGIVTNERQDIARALIRQGMAEAVDPKELEMVARPGEQPYRIPKPGDFKMPEPKWLVDLHTRAQVLVIQMAILGQFYFYSGDPSDANRTEKWNGQPRFINGFNRAIPQPILEEYKRRWKAEPNHRDVPKFVSANPSNADSENEQRKAEQKRYDDAVRNGNVPYSGTPA